MGFDRAEQLDHCFSLGDLGLVDAPPEEAFDNLDGARKNDVPEFRSLWYPLSKRPGIGSSSRASRACRSPGPPCGRRPLSHSFCKYVVWSNHPLVVEKSVEHSLVCDNGAVHDLDVKAYLGVPIVAQGNIAVGALCVIDTKERQWSDGDVMILEQFASCVSDAIRLKGCAQD